MVDEGREVPPVVDDRERRAGNGLGKMLGPGHGRLTILAPVPGR